MERSTIVFDGDSEKAVFSEFSIVGTFSDIERNFVQHVAILDGDNTLPGTVRVYHMRPPLVSGSELPLISDDKKELTPHLAVALDLDEKQLDLIASWAEEIAMEVGPMGNDRYVILPAVEPSLQLSEKGQPKYHRFRCAGYVTEALKQADVELCDFDALPLADAEFLKPAYPVLPAILKHPKKCEQLGVESDPPWPILLPGYLFHGADSFMKSQNKITPILTMAYHSKSV